MTIARTNIPRCSLRCRSITPHCRHRRSISPWGNSSSNTARTSLPVILSPPSISPVLGGLPLARSMGSRTRGEPAVKGGSVATTPPIALSRHTCARPYDPLTPLICYDERPCQLLGDVLVPIPMQPGQPKRYDHE